MKAYNVTLFLIMFAASIVVINSMDLFGDQKNYVKDDGTVTGVNQWISDWFPKATESLPAEIIAMTTFSLLIYAISPVLLFFAFSILLLDIYLPLLGIPLYFTAPLTLGVNIIFILGYNQFRARQSLQGLE